MSRTARPVPEFKLRKISNKENLYICWSENRRSRRVSTGTNDPVAAQQFLADFIRGWSAPTPRDQILCDEIIDLYIKHKKPEYQNDIRSKSNFVNIEVSLKPIRDYFGKTNPSKIARQHSRDFIDFQRKKNLGDATIRRQLTFFTAALNFAKAEGYIDIVPSIEKPREPPPRDVWMTPDQVKMFLETCQTPHVRLFTLLALHTLSRKAAILDLQWEQVDLDNRLIDFNPQGRNQTKKKRVAVRINDPLFKALKEAKEFAKTEFVIEYNGKRVFDNKKAFKQVAIKCDLPWVTPHVLRHTGATLLAQKGVPFWEIAGIMGDRLATVEKHYAKHHPEYLKNAVDTLENLYG